jgi:hypothetical protein
MNIKADKMRYQTNKTGYGLILLGLVFSVVSLFMLITPSTIVPNFGTAIEILVNIVLMLVTFLAAERCKFYSKNWATVSIFIAGIHFVRALITPISLFTLGQISFLIYILSTSFLITASIFILIGAKITLDKFHILSKHMKEIGE